MTKRPAEAPAEIPFSDPHHPWIQRGYKPELAYSLLNRRPPTEDPYGELAYQRAFAKAAEAQSRRVPDPVLYPNSPSAQAYIKFRDEALFSPKSQWSESAEQPKTETSTDPSTRPHPQEKLPSPRYRDNPLFPPRTIKTDPYSEMVPSMSTTSPAKPGHHGFSRDVNPAIEHRPITPRPLPMTLEPRLDAPSGPSRMLR